MRPPEPANLREIRGTQCGSMAQSGATMLSLSGESVRNFDPNRAGSRTSSQAVVAFVMRRSPRSRAPPSPMTIRRTKACGSIPLTVSAVAVAALVGACGPSFPAVHANQAGYIPHAAKIAIATNDAPSALGWTLIDAGGSVVAQGKTKVFGDDSASGEHVHWADFSAYDQAGKGYQLRVGSDVSFAFDIDSSAYRKLKYDALRYFYYNRSGVAITLPFAVDFKWTRPPGHLSDAMVSCIGKSCGYRLDVTGGWYDAGDHGKYVVNGGLSAWTLLNLYERTLYLGSSLDEFADDKLMIPESGNGVNDLLDEARWEVEFILKMQVPEGQPKAGMVHHKIHDTSWTMLGTTPPTETDTRYLHAPSTAATLNLVAVAAQSARIWRQIDPPFAARCLLAAKRGWNAASGFPAVYASSFDKEGGGPYDDKEVSDEFYWAAAELYVTTGLPGLLKYLRASEHFLKVPKQVGHERIKQFTAWTWQATGALGSVSLAVVPGVLGIDELASVRGAIVAAADEYAAELEKQGYRVPFRPGTDGKYPWGSNSFVANNAIVLALAHDFTKRSRYLDGVVQSLDYLLGKSPNGISYVTGYDEYAFENPHHRHWAHMRSPRIPRPPPGALSGGPNSSLQDPLARRRRSGCAPMTCYVDHVDAWSVNEVAINWNAPLSWLAAFVDEAARMPHADKAPSIPRAEP